MSRARHDDDELDADARALLDALRDEETLPPEVEDRVWARLDASVAGQRRRRMAGVALGTLALAAGIAFLWVGGRAVVEPESTTTEPGQQAPFVADERTTPGAVAPRSPLPTHESSEPHTRTSTAPVAEQDTVVAPASPTVAPIVSRAGGKKAAPERPTAEPRTEDSLGDEMALLGEARRVLSTGDPRRALALLDEHARRFPQGMLAQERSALRVIALCDADRTDEGRRAATRFLDRHPDAALADRVRQACAAPVTDAGGGGL